MYPIFDDIWQKMRNYVTLKLDQKSHTFDVKEVSDLDLFKAMGFTANSTSARKSKTYV